jgi:hypothetical protein
MFNSTKELRDELDSAQSVIMDIGHQLNLFKREMRAEVAHLESALKKAQCVPPIVSRVELDTQMYDDIKYLKDRYEILDQWDSRTRDKFRVIENHLGIRIENGMHVVDDPSEED